MNREQLPQQMIYLALVTLFAAVVSGCGAMQSLFAVPTSPILPKSGPWTASAES
jgi:hypothetical protein